MYWCCCPVPKPTHILIALHNVARRTQKVQALPVVRQTPIRSDLAQSLAQTAHIFFNLMLPILLHNVRRRTQKVQAIPDMRQPPICSDLARSLPNSLPQSHLTNSFTQRSTPDLESSSASRHQPASRRAQRRNVTLSSPKPSPLSFSPRSAIKRTASG